MWEVQLTVEVGRDYEAKVFTLIYCVEGVATELGTGEGFLLFEFDNKYLLQNVALQLNGILA
jgi:hypothetical protein